MIRLRECAVPYTHTKGVLTNLIAYTNFMGWRRCQLLSPSRLSEGKRIRHCFWAIADGLGTERSVPWLLGPGVHLTLGFRWCCPVAVGALMWGARRMGTIRLIWFSFELFAGQTLAREDCP